MFIFRGLVIFIYVFVTEVSWQLTRQRVKRPYLYYAQGTYNSGVLDTRYIYYINIVPRATHVPSHISNYLKALARKTAVQLFK